MKEGLARPVAYLGFPAPGDKVRFGAPPPGLFAAAYTKSEFGVKGCRKLTRAQHLVVSTPA